MSKFQQEVKPIEKVRHEIIRDNEESPYVIMKMLYSLAPTYYDRQYSKFN